LRFLGGHKTISPNYFDGVPPTTADLRVHDPYKELVIIAAYIDNAHGNEKLFPIPYTEHRVFFESTTRQIELF
jgi:hypothetical protein